MVIFLALACLRYLHLCRSYFTEATQDFMFGHCVQGKRRRQGTCPPYSWAVPRISCLGKSPFEFLVHLHVKLGFPSVLLASPRSAGSTTPSAPLVAQVHALCPDCARCVHLRGGCSVCWGCCCWWLWLLWCGGCWLRWLLQLWFLAPPGQDSARDLGFSF